MEDATLVATLGSRDDLAIATTADVVVEAVTPFRTRMTELLDDPAELDRLLARGAERATVVADATMSRIRDAVGLLPALPATGVPGAAG